MSISEAGLQERASRALVWTVVEKWGGRLISLGVLLVLTRLVTPSEFGTIAIALAVIAFANVLVDSGFARALVQRSTIRKVDESTVFWIAFTTATLVYSAIFWVAPALEDSYHMDGLTNVLRVLGATVILGSVASVPAALLERNFAFKQLSVRVLIANIASAAIAVPLALSGAGVWALVAQYLTAQAFSTVTLLFAARWRPHATFSWQSARELLPFGVSVLGVKLLDTLQAQADKVVVGALLGAESLGVYFVAQRVLLVISDLFTAVVGRITLTTFSRAQSDLSRVNRGYLRMTFLSGLVGIPPFLILGLTAETVFPLLAGDSWADSAQIVQVLCVSFALTAVIYFDKDVLLAVGKPLRALRLGLFENVASLAALAVAAPFGVVAVALSRVAQRLAAWPYRIYLLRRSFELDFLGYVRSVGSPLSAVVAAVAIFELLAWALPGDSRGSLAVTLPSAGALAAYFATAVATGGRENRSSIRVVIRSTIPRSRARHREH